MGFIEGNDCGTVERANPAVARDARFESRSSFFEHGND